MGTIPRVSVLTGARRPVPAAPLTTYISRHLGDHHALVFSDETSTKTVSYSELEASTNALGRAVALKARAKGANANGDFIIAVCMLPTHKTILTLLSCWKAGAAYVPLEPSFPQGTITHILNDCKPALVVYDDSVNPACFLNSDVPSLPFDELLSESKGLPSDALSCTEMLGKLSADSVAIVLYTSGSTGKPKGVRLTFSAICNRLWWQFRTFPFSESEVNCVWKTALTFLDSMCEIWGPLLQGRTLVILRKEVTRDPEKLVTLLAENQIQRLVLVPTLLRSILMYLSLNPSERPLKHLKLWVCSGETLSKHLASQFFNYFGNQNGIKLANFYGSTEVMGDVTYYVLENAGKLDLFPSIPIGTPLDNCAVYLLDEEMNLAKESEPGEMWVGGANLAAGYVGGKATESFCHNPHAAHTGYNRLYRTGDFGTIQNGMIIYVGRTDTQVKIRGNKVDLLEVEKAVTAIRGVDKAVVLCYGLDRGDPEILAFVTIQPGANLSAYLIESALTNSLVQYMIPQVIMIDTIPLLVSGKVDRQALLKMYENTNNNDVTEIPLEMDYTGVDPHDRLKAEVLFSTVRKVLGRAARAQISVREGFFELGGNSLNSIYTITQLRDKGYYIQISDFLNATNLGEVLTHMTTNPSCEGDNNEPKFKAEPMRDEHKQPVIEMLSSFCKNVKECQKQDIKQSCYGVYVDACWDPLLAARLSVVLTDATDTPVAVVLNFDARDKPDIELSGGLAKFMSFLDYIESSVRDTMLPKGKGAILHSVMMATSSSLSPRDNVLAIQALEHATARVARDRRFRGVFTTNTSPLTQQLGTDILGFQTLLDYQINQYMDLNGERIFGKAPDDMRAIVCWKPVD